MQPQIQIPLSYYIILLYDATSHSPFPMSQAPNPFSKPTKLFPLTSIPCTPLSLFQNSNPSMRTTRAIYRIYNGMIKTPHHLTVLDSDTATLRFFTTNRYPESVVSLTEKTRKLHTCVAIQIIKFPSVQKINHLTSPGITTSSSDSPSRSSSPFTYVASPSTPIALPLSI